MEEKTIPWLSNFIIFNPTLCKKEGQEAENILFYYSSDKISEDVKVRQIGLCEGMINFTRRFSNNACEVLETKRTRQVYYGPEDNFWMILTVGIPEKGCTFVSNLTLRSLLITSYDLFTLFYGTFGNLQSKVPDTKTLRSKLERFFVPYQKTLNIGESDIMNHIIGVQFLPLDPNTYLCTQRLLSSLQDRFSPVQYTMLLYKEKLTYSSLNKQDTRVLYHYLVNILFPAHLETSGMEIISKSLQTMGRYLNGPTDFEENIRASRLHLTTDSKDGALTQVFLLVYNNLDTTICLMIDTTTSCTKTFYKSLNQFLSTNVITIDNIISKQVMPMSVSVPPPPMMTNSDYTRYLLYNYDNLAYLSTLNSNPPLSSYITRIVCDIAALIINKRNADIMIKTGSEVWISARKCESRVLIALILQRNMHHMQVVEEVKKLSLSLFNKTYFCEF